MGGCTHLTRGAGAIIAAVVCVLAVVSAAFGVRHAESRGLSATLTTGFASDPLLDNPTLIGISDATQNRWLQRAVTEGAGVVRVDVHWASIAPSNPLPGWVASNTSSPGYEWAALDKIVRAIASHGLMPLLMLYMAPGWAEGGSIPAGTNPGTWEPDPTRYAAFATATASRYSGYYPDSVRPGHYLPRVRLWQAWNQPNQAYYLGPQRTADGQPNSPNLYRPLLDAFYTAVKAVNPTNFVISAGTAAYGNAPNVSPPSAQAMRPLIFYRSLFCVNRALRSTPCPGPVYLDAIDHHPYQVLPPQNGAQHPDDVAVPDVWKVTRLLNAGIRAGHVLPDTHKQVWVEEFSWDTSPPSANQIAVSPALQACNIELSDYLLWRQGVSTVMFLQLRDWTANTPRTAPYRWGGMYYTSGAPKPSATAFRFPLVAQRTDVSTVNVWGRSPASGLLVIRHRTLSGDWSTLSSQRVLAKHVFQTNVRFRGPVYVAASVAGQSSLPWTSATAKCLGH